ncbi:hypothetical protein GUITHDRAFT_118653 [Guillardia theta CCMP2712]|uniref:RWP-RK domain-containing protein n=1 Tax=Guillardia theta (strain CCMP2712) TaxID=905079 RepID=L1IGJ1_GUITC|nr:hypothetical protein GUITHDRAFT_118653 [Guillardia theta CCMP2712]EKX35207.1 hypothetical protein GUITHDRAFT_118653 [Guillardia theta CCMP2712]|eukprot:XP_005822187.1 hypothetical protein GUITHDRAFT_118653 [Guillardia theta CCMP2712]
MGLCRSRMVERLHFDGDISFEGISLTSFKSACRKIGVSRWPYDRWEPADDDSLRKHRRKKRASRKIKEEANASPKDGDEAEPVALLPFDSVAAKTQGEETEIEDGSSTDWLQQINESSIEAEQCGLSAESCFFQDDLVFYPISQEDRDHQWMRYFLQS